MKNLETARMYALAFLVMSILSACGIFGTVFFYLGWLVIAFIAFIILTTKLAANSVNMVDILNALSFSEWKTVKNIEKELQKTGRIKGTPRESTGILFHLSCFENEGLAESRVNPLLRIHHRKRGKAPPIEYRRLSSRGRPRRVRKLFDLQTLIPVRTMG